MADASYDGWSPERLRERLGVPSVEVRSSVTSTLDVAHELAREGASAGTVVLAERQTAGRGRGGKHWVSEAGSGIWLTIVERPRHADVLDVLALRLGLAAAPVLEQWAPASIGLKWPNDLVLGGAKLAGVLVEARWRDARVDWVAVGVGINVRLPAGAPDAAALREGASRPEILSALVPALRRAAAARGPLTGEERAAWAEHDVAAGRRCREPVMGTVLGVAASGALMVRTAQGDVECRSGSLVFAEDA